MPRKREEREGERGGRKERETGEGDKEKREERVSKLASLPLCAVDTMSVLIDLLFCNWLTVSIIH